MNKLYEMGQLKILASGNSPHAQAQARGKLFEKLMSDVLRHYGYSIDRIPNVNYAGMEIDIEGKAIATGIPLYAECKCYETEIDSPKLNEFVGKYMARWRKDKRCQGLFIALPGVNSYAKGYYRENWEKDPEATVRLYEEEQVLEAIFGTQAVASPDVITRLITKDVGTPGDWLLLYTEKGLYWVQYVIPPGGGISSSIALFDARGNPLSDEPTLDYLTQLYPGLNDFNKLAIGSPTTPRLSKVPKDVEEIVEVRGSSECFEYQFPASPEYFVGRSSVLEEVDSFVTKVIDKETSSRGILFEANSGWGKSSVVLASAARLNKMGHFAVAIDSRSAASSQFILRVIDYAFSKFGDFGGLSEDNKLTAITGFDGAVKALLNVGQVLERNHKVMFIFLDQFENIFFLPETLKRIADLLLKICDAQTNVVLGFSWKTDLIGLTSEFPYQLRDSITNSSRRIALETFSEVETNALLNKLSEELRAPLRKDLRFFLSEFSQGYPWLLKKLCAHVKAQREAGVLQSDLANSLLNIEELFQEDLRGLSLDEEDALRRIAKAAPISVSELGEELKPEVVQSLVSRRLVVRIGNTFDVYWDIFRDYLNSGRVPAQENYILRTSTGSVLNVTKLLTEAKGVLDISELRKQAGLTQNSFYNVIKDARLLGIAKVEDGKVTLQISLPKETKAFKDSMRSHLIDRLKRNRLSLQLINKLKTAEGDVALNLDEVSSLLAEWCPYISATKKTWQTYARIFADWMDFADLAIFDVRDGTLSRYRPGAEVRDHSLLLGRRRGGMMIPCIRYTPVEKVAIRLVEALQNNRRIDWTGLKKSTRVKALATLEDFDFVKQIKRENRSIIRVRPKTREFVLYPDKRPALFAEGAMKMRSFTTFIDILTKYKDAGLTLSQLALELRKKLDANWTDGTAEWVTKIMLDWARHTGLAPGAFAKAQSKQGRYRKKQVNGQTSLLL